MKMEPSISISFCLVFLGSAFLTSCTVYYVSNNGNDTADGLSPDAAWQSLNRVNEASLKPGDSVLFRRGDVWRGQLRPCSGEKGRCIHYGAFGEGDKPLLLGSMDFSTPEAWSDDHDGIWTTPEGLASPWFLCNDVGNMILDGEKRFGVKVWERADLDTQGEFWYDEEQHTVSMFSADNPGLFYSHIEAAIREHIVDQEAKHDILYEGLAFKYGGAHGIAGGNTHTITVRDCDFGFIGGGDQCGGSETVRFGNGVEFWGTAHDHLVERCRFWEIYDAAMTNQSNGPLTPQYNIVYRNNLVWNCEYSFEYWNYPEESETYNVVFKNNVCLNAGGGWGHPQRPDPSGRHLCFYASPAQLHDMLIRSNIFFNASQNAFYAPQWSRAAVDALLMDKNVWYQPDGTMINIAGLEYSMAQFDAYRAEFSKEPNSCAGIPNFEDWGDPSFRLCSESPPLGEAAIYAQHY